MKFNKTLKNGNLMKLVAFFMIALIIVYAIAFASHGRQSQTQDPDSGDADNTISDTDENKDGNEDIQTSLPIPEYLHYITGKQTTKDTYTKKPLCFIFDAKGQVYGYSNTYLTIEIPTEDNNSRLLCFMDNTDNLGKIGSITQSRKYINSVAQAFGAVLITNGYDDSFDYSVNSLGGTVIDLTQESGLHYTEYNTYAYSNGELMSTYTREEWNPISHALPYIFCDVDTKYVPNGTKANSVLITFGAGNSTELSYSPESKQYSLMKNGTEITDSLNNKGVDYDNVFVLMCDSATKETAEFTKTVMLTDNSGSGYYISQGKAISITWHTNADGTLTFLSDNGQQLVVNRGTSYIAYAKSSMPNNVKIL